jgi:hypothetical protein
MWTCPLAASTKIRGWRIDGVSVARGVTVVRVGMGVEGRKVD